MTTIGRRRASAAVTGAITAAITAAMLLLMPVSALAHGPDPLIPGSGNLWGRDQVVPFQWATAGVPPAWAAAAMDAGVADVIASRNARAAVFVRASSASAYMSYGWTLCDSVAIACMDRTGMDNGIFRIWFRPQGYAYDWGTLRWCQYYDVAPTGCYDLENTTLDELGHVEVLGHHVNFSDESDFTDAVVQFSGHAKPRAGWNQHVYGRCDVARLQLEYERRDPGNLVSTCLSLSSAITFTASTDNVVVGDLVRFTVTLRIGVSSGAGALSGDPLSDRTVLLQRKLLGTSTWSTVGAMTASPTTEGAYSMSVGPTATYDWRAVFASPSNEGVSGATSATTRVAATSCTGGGCPLAAGR